MGVKRGLPLFFGLIIALADVALTPIRAVIHLERFLKARVILDRPGENV